MKSITEAVYEVVSKKSVTLHEVHKVLPSFTELQVNGALMWLLRRKKSPIYRYYTENKVPVYTVKIEEAIKQIDIATQQKKNSLNQPIKTELSSNISQQITQAVESVERCLTPVKNNEISKIEVEGVGRLCGTSTAHHMSELQSTIQAVGVQIAEMIVGSIISNITPMIEQRVSDLVKNLIPTEPIVPTKPVAAVTPKVKLRKILVVGLLPNQENEIQAEFKNDLQISFWSTGENTSLLKSKASNVECVFVHVKHMSHSAEAILKSAKATVVNVPGGLTMMKDAITNFYCNS